MDHWSLIKHLVVLYSFWLFTQILSKSTHYEPLARAYLGRTGGVMLAMLCFLLTSASLPTSDAFLSLSSSLSRRSFFTVRSCSDSLFSKSVTVSSLRVSRYSSSWIFCCCCSKLAELEERFLPFQRDAILQQVLQVLQTRTAQLATTLQAIKTSRSLLQKNMQVCKHTPNWPAIKLTGVARSRNEFH